MFTDLHNHTCHFSPDAEMTIDELISTAKARGITHIGITEHYEIDNPDPNDNIQTFDLDEYYKAFKAWRTKCPDDVKLLMGIEFGYQTSTAGKIDKAAKELPFDCIILSNHLFRGVDVYFSNECYRVDQLTRHREYVGVLAEMAEKCSEYDVIGHYDYINRHNPDKDTTVFYNDCPDEFDRLFEIIIAKEKALEINTRSIESQIRRFSPFIMPDSGIIKRYLDMGGQLISLGSDSHTPDTLGLHFAKTAEHLKSLGVKEICRFENRKPVTEALY